MQTTMPQASPLNSKQGKTRSRYGILLVCLSLLVMLCTSLWKWCDPVVDFGRELYVPWAMLEGKTLYKDIFYFNGPLSPAWNYTLFKICGTGLHVLAAANLTLFIALLILIYKIATRVASETASLLSCLLVVMLFGFSQYHWVRNYNFITPYSHEMTHGMLLCLGLLACMSAMLSKNKIIWRLTAGACYGLIFLTKPEFFIAASGAVLAFCIFLARLRGLRQALSFLPFFAAAALLPVFAAYGLLRQWLPADLAVQGFIGGWRYVNMPDLRALPFYQELMGTDDIAGSLLKMGLGMALYAFFIGGATVAGSGKMPPSLARITAILPAALIVALFVLWPQTVSLTSPYTVFLVLLCIGTGVRAWRQRSPRWGLACIFCFISLLLLAKIILRPLVYHYGFALGMPATVVMICLLFSWIPEHLKRPGWNAGAYYLCVGCVLACSCILPLFLTWQWYTIDMYAVGRDGDRFLADHRGMRVQEVLDWLESDVPPEATLMALPEGVMVNFLSRRENPTSYTNFMPPEMLMFGEDDLMRQLQASPPDIVLLIHKRTKEYGYEWFGKDYGLRIMDWLRSCYTPVRRFGAVPFQGEDFGIIALQWRGNAVLCAPPRAP